MSRRIFVPLRPTPLTAGNGIAAGNGPIRQGSPGFRPVIVRPQVTRHGGGGGGHGGGGHGHGGHHANIIGSGPGYSGSDGGWNNGGRGPILASLGLLTLWISVLILIALHENAALLVILAIIIGAPLLGIVLVLLVALLAWCFGWRKESSGTQ